MPTLRKLLLRRTEWLNVKSLINKIDLIIPNLEELELNGIYWEKTDLNLMKITNLKKLRKLAVDFRFKNPVRFLNVLSNQKMPLEDLTIIRCIQSTEMVNEIVKIKTLKKFTLSDSYLLLNDLNDMINHLPELRSLILHRLQLDATQIMREICINKSHKITEIGLLHIPLLDVSDESMNWVETQLRETNRKMRVEIETNRVKLSFPSKECRTSLTHTLLNITLTQSRMLCYNLYCIDDSIKTSIFNINNLTY